MRPYRRDFVARIKGALLAGLQPKWLAAKSGVPIDTIKEWSAESARADVPADATVEQDVYDALLGKFVGSDSTR